MHILLTGSTGFIGLSLCSALLNKGHTLTVWTHHPDRAQALLPKNIKKVTSLHHVNKPVEAIINLAGAPIAKKRWTTERKNILYKSRLKTTEKLVKWCQKQTSKPKVFLSGSAVGYYGMDPQHTFTEDSPPFSICFASTLCREWEHMALQAENQGIRVVLLRTGLVLGKNGGALPKITLPFKIFMGGPIGEGDQWMSWIHQEDVMRMIIWALDHENVSGPLNLTAPNPCPNTTFSYTLAKALHRPTWLRTPAWILKMLYGEQAAKSFYIKAININKNLNPKN